MKLKTLMPLMLILSACAPKTNYKMVYDSCLWFEELPEDKAEIMATLPPKWRIWTANYDIKYTERCIDEE